MTRRRRLMMDIGVPLLLLVLFIIGTSLYRGKPIGSSVVDPGLPMLFVSAVMIGWNLFRSRQMHRDA